MCGIRSRKCNAMRRPSLNTSPLWVGEPMAPTRHQHVFPLKMRFSSIGMNFALNGCLGVSKESRLPLPLCLSNEMVRRRGSLASYVLPFLHSPYTSLWFYIPFTQNQHFVMSPLQ